MQWNVTLRIRAVVPGHTLAHFDVNLGRRQMIFIFSWVRWSRLQIRMNACLNVKGVFQQGTAVAGRGGGSLCLAQPVKFEAVYHGPKALLWGAAALETLFGQKGKPKTERT